MPVCKRCNCDLLEDDVKIDYIGFGFPTTLCMSCADEWVDVFFSDNMKDNDLQLEIDFLFKIRNRGDLPRILQLSREQDALRHKVRKTAIKWVEAGC